MNLASKRGDNEGSIFKRKDGRWCTQVSLNDRHITQYAKSQQECDDWNREITNQIQQGMTFDATQLA
jgi:hypothetical protein